MIWCTNYSNVHVHNFRKHWVSLEGDFSLWVSLINYCLEKEIFPTKLKILDVSPIFQKNKNFDKENHRPISNLPHLSKVCEKIIYRQIDKFMSPKFSPILCGLWKITILSTLLLKWLKFWKNTLIKVEGIRDNQPQCTLEKTRNIGFLRKLSEPFTEITK